MRLAPLSSVRWETAHPRDKRAMFCRHTGEKRKVTRPSMSVSSAHRRASVWSTQGPWWRRETSFPDLVQPTWGETLLRRQREESLSTRACAAAVLCVRLHKHTYIHTVQGLRRSIVR